VPSVTRCNRRDPWHRGRNGANAAAAVRPGGPIRVAAGQAAIAEFNRHRIGTGGPAALRIQDPGGAARGVPQTEERTAPAGVGDTDPILLADIAGGDGPASAAANGDGHVTLPPRDGRGGTQAVPLRPGPRTGQRLVRAVPFAKRN